MQSSISISDESLAGQPLTNYTLLAVDSTFLGVGFEWNREPNERLVVYAACLAQSGVNDALRS
jgi:hypothetical protein